MHFQRLSKCTPSNGTRESKGSQVVRNCWCCGRLTCVMGGVAAAAFMDYGTKKKSEMMKSNLIYINTNDFDHPELPHQELPTNKKEKLHKSRPVVFNRSIDGRSPARARPIWTPSQMGEEENGEKNVPHRILSSVRVLSVYGVRIRIQTKRVIKHNRAATTHLIPFQSYRMSIYYYDVVKNRL